MTYFESSIVKIVLDVEKCWRQFKRLNARSTGFIYFERGKVYWHTNLSGTRCSEVARQRVHGYVP
jgi:hypothetical protein